MAWDPQTGMWSEDITRHPYGALGSAMQFFNARKAGDISGQLEQRRMQELEQEQFKLDEARKAVERDAQLRQAMAEIPETAGYEDITRTYIRKGGDPSKLPSLLRTGMSGDIRTNLQGMKGDQALEQIATKEELPSTQAGIGKTKAETENLQTRTGDITATQPGRVDLLKATAEARRQYAAMVQKKKAGGEFTENERALILDKIARRELEIQTLTTEKDIYGRRRTRKNLSPEEQAAVEELRKIQAAQKALLGEEEVPTSDVESGGSAVIEESDDPFEVFPK